MILSTAYFLALLFLPRAVPNELLPCSREWFLDYDEPNAKNCTTSTNNANFTKYGRVVQPLDLVEASDESEILHLGRWDYLFCCVVSQPYCPNIRWFKDGKELNSKYENGLEIIEGGRVLRLLPTLSSPGNYNCTATTPYGENVSYTMKVEVQVTCTGSSHLKPEPEPDESGVIEVIRGTNKTLTCEFYCGDRQGLHSDTWRNGKGELIVPGPNYILSTYRRTDTDNPYSADRIESLTIVNFTKSENITCSRKQNFNDDHLINATFHLVPKECFGTPEIVQTPGGQDAIRVAKGSNETFTCQFFCLESKNFGKFTWIFANGEPIPNNSSKYKLVERPINTNELSFGRRRLNYEMSLTIMNISDNEIFSCNHSSPNEKQTDSKTFRLLVEKDAIQVPISTETEGFFKRAGMWIVIGGLLAMLVVVSFLSFRYRRTINRRFKLVGSGRSSKPHKNARYDAFISYSDKDGRSFVTSKLVTMLEDQCGYKLCLRYRDFPAGAAFVDNTVQCIDDSRKILMVITRDFLDNQWSMYEVDQGLLRSVFKPNTVMVIILNKIPRTDLPPKLQKFTDKTSYLVWDDSKSDKMCEKIMTKLGSPSPVKNPGVSEDSTAGQRINSCV